MNIDQQLQDLYTRESFALAQGREDLLDEIDRERRELIDRRDEQEAAEAGELR